MQTTNVNVLEHVHLPLQIHNLEAVVYEGDDVPTITDLVSIRDAIVIV